MLVSLFDDDDVPDSPEQDVVPETQPTREDDGGVRRNKRSHKRKPTGEPRAKAAQIRWTSNEEMNLARAWLEITEDPKCGKFILYFFKTL